MTGSIRVACAAVAACAAIAVAGCHSSSSVHAAATGTAAAQAKQDLANISAKCGTSSAAGQLAAAKAMTTHNGRQALFAKCGVPKANRPALEAKALDAAEHAHLTTHEGRVNYFTLTLPTLIEQAQA